MLESYTQSEREDTRLRAVAQFGVIPVPALAGNDKQVVGAGVKREAGGLELGTNLLRQVVGELKLRATQERTAHHHGIRQSPHIVQVVIKSVRQGNIHNFL